MAPILPANFLDLRSVSSKSDGSIVNIMGVVTDFMPPRQSRGTDYTSQFHLADHSYGTLGIIGEEGLKIRCFNLIESNLPPVRGKGDVVILRSGKVSSYSGMKWVLSNRVSSWVVIPSTAFPDQMPQSSATSTLNHQRSMNSPMLIPKEISYAHELYHLNDRAAYGGRVDEVVSTMSTEQTAPPATQKAPRQHCLLQDVNIDTFYDLIVQVIKIYPSSQKVEIYVTDYTKNQMFWQYREEDVEVDRNGDEFGYLDDRRTAKSKWPGPWAKYTMTVTLFSPHSYFAESTVKPDDFVYLRNVRTKWSKDSKIEGVLHTDRFKPDKVNISVIKDIEDDEKVKDLLRRKREYWRNYNKENPKSGESLFDEESGTKRKAGEDAKPLSKAQRKRQKRSERKAATKAKIQKAEFEDDAPAAESLSVAKHSDASKVDVDLNPNIRCAHHTQPIRPISSIKSLDAHKHQTPTGIDTTLPFHNINSRTTVRVVDFWPDNLASFTIRERRKDIEDALISPDISSASESEDADSDSGASSDSENQSSRWVWGFRLQLEDASQKRKSQAGNAEDERIWVTVAAQDAEYLLKLDASNLHKDSEGLSALKERLFLLWGDLEERKNTRLQAAPENSSDDQDAMEVDNKIDETNLVSGPVFQCCLKEYGVKVRKHQEEKEADATVMDMDSLSDADEEHDLVPGEKGYRRNWIYERRWQMWGCTII